MHHPLNPNTGTMKNVTQNNLPSAPVFPLPPAVPFPPGPTFASPFWRWREDSVSSRLHQSQLGVKVQCVEMDRYLFSMWMNAIGIAKFYIDPSRGGVKTELVQIIDGELTTTSRSLIRDQANDYVRNFTDNEQEKYLIAKAFFQVAHSFVGRYMMDGVRVVKVKQIDTETSQARRGNPLRIETIPGPSRVIANYAIDE